MRYETRKGKNDWFDAKHGTNARWLNKFGVWESKLFSFTMPQDSDQEKDSATLRLQFEKAWGHAFEELMQIEGFEPYEDPWSK